MLEELAAAGYWGLLVDRQYGGHGTPLGSFMPFLTQMATVDPTTGASLMDRMCLLGLSEYGEGWLPEH